MASYKEPTSSSMLLSGHNHLPLAVSGLLLNHCAAIIGSTSRILLYDYLYHKLQLDDYGSTERLKQDVPRILDSIDGLTALVIEGGGNLANVWLKEAERRGKRVFRIGAETWRPLFLYPREQKSGLGAKKHAGELALNVII